MSCIKLKNCLFLSSSMKEEIDQKQKEVKNFYWNGTWFLSKTLYKSYKVRISRKVCTFALNLGSKCVPHVYLYYTFVFILSLIPYHYHLNVPHD